jgi:hypothetical protein
MTPLLAGAVQTINFSTEDADTDDLEGEGIVELNQDFQKLLIILHEIHCHYFVFSHAL